jgi:ribosomal protein S18 acetylase RimI-like enzyme
MNDLPVQLRRARAGDEISISSVLLEAFNEYLPQYTPAGFAATTPSPSEVLQRMEEGPVWLAMIESDIVGTVSAVLRGEQELYIRGMAVLPEARGQQIGKLLFELVEEYAKGNGCTKLVLSTTPFLDRAIRLYERLGFVKTTDGPHDLHGTPLVTMEKPLDSGLNWKRSWEGGKRFKH